jgi:signal peptidase II
MTPTPDARDDRPAPAKHRTAFVLIAVSGALLDLATKAWAFGVLREHERIDAIPGWLGWRESWNPGIVWGLFQDYPGIFTALAAVAVPLIVLLFWRTPAPRRLFTVALGLILAGALGNLYDRLVYGKVRDFIDFYAIDYPVFNVADSMICVGVGLLAWHLAFGPKETPASPGAPGATKNA